MGKWTKGPWDTANDGRDVISASTGYIVCETSGNEADARLIAAAPEMAELLERMCARAKDEGWIEVRDARALLERVGQ